MHFAIPGRTRRGKSFPPPLPHNYVVLYPKKKKSSFFFLGVFFGSDPVSTYPQLSQVELAGQFPSLGRNALRSRFRWGLTIALDKHVSTKLTPLVAAKWAFRTVICELSKYSSLLSALGDARQMGLPFSK